MADVLKARIQPVTWCDWLDQKFSRQLGPENGKMRSKPDAEQNSH